MFVRWKRRKLRNRHKSYGGRMVETVNTRGDSLDAVVVENTREEKKIRQRVICHLGVVHEKTAHEIRDRVLFWKYTVPKLDHLSIDQETRVKLEAQLSAIIPKASKREIDQYETETASRFRRLVEGVRRSA